ncbi:MAG TPA: cardiolipin synthase, partial [Gemmataceae bacterium]|nr:cardiolipin synthase [Gemmataceae bacterium]
LAWLPFLLGLTEIAIVVLFIGWALMTKTDSTSAMAWCLLIFFLPFVGAALFYLLGYQHVTRPLRRKRRHKQRYRAQAPRTPSDADVPPLEHEDQAIQEVADLHREMHLVAARAGAYPLTLGNHVEMYHEGQPAFEAMLGAIQTAKHHIHWLTFIFQYDEIGRTVLEMLTRKAREGVKVRLLYDAMGSRHLSRQRLQEFRAAGGMAHPFLPVDPLHRRIQVNLRNHRKILVVDGQVGFVGGLNVGDEYLGKVERFGFWRDTHLRLEGPAVGDLQRVFAEDWDFACTEQLCQPDDAVANTLYYQPKAVDGPYPAQIIESGPDRDVKPIREVYFAAILKARKRVWIASPYFVPDNGLRDALRLAGQLGIDVRFLGQHHPDKWLAQYAARFYWGQVLPAGVKIYQYTKGMMHSKVVMVDGIWASVGSANLDNRSLHLNFEVNCLLYSRAAVAELEAAFERDLADAIRLDRHVYSKRPFPGRLMENACRLFSPVL